MFQLWRQKIREAAVAYRNGQLDDAGTLLQRDNLREFRPGRKLAVKVAAGMAERAKGQAALGNTAAGWRDLQAATALQADSQQVQAVYETLLARGLDEIERYLAAGDTQQAVERLARLAERHPPTAAMRLLRRVANHLQAAAQAGRKGQFEAATEQLASAAELRPDLDWFPRRLEACNLKDAQYRRAVVELQAALAERDWATVLGRADALLALAPECPLGLTARRRAWDALQPPVPELGVRGAPTVALGRRGMPMESREPTHEAATGQRMILWIDAVGGFLVCLGDEIVLGRPAEGPGVDVPILADLSRRHAVIRRDGEAYLLEAMRATKVDGRAVLGVTSLTDGSSIELGGAVELRFRRPHPLSTSARLEITSGHKTVPHLDAILLMAESCVLGPAWHNHVVCRPWQQDVVLFRQQNQLLCRSKAGLIVAGQPHSGSLPLNPGVRVEGEDLAFSVERAV
jgi:hypothetical protein